MTHLSSNNQLIIEKLASQPKLVMSSHGKHKAERLSNRQQSASGRFGRVELWEPNVDIRDLLQRSDVVFTNDMAGLYVEVNLTFSLKQGLELLSQYVVHTFVMS